MKQEIMEMLSRITEEEEVLMEGGVPLHRDLYSRSSKFMIEKKLLSSHVYGNTNSPILLRTHTRFSDFPPHSHDYIELMYVCSGQITHVIGGHEIILSRGDILMLGRSTVHAVRRSDICDIGINIIISYDFFNALCNRLNSAHPFDKSLTLLTRSDENTYCVFHTDGVQEIENLLENMILPLLTGTSKSASVLQMEFELMSAYLSALPGSQAEYQSNASHTEKQIRELNDYIETCYQHATLTDLAEKLGFSPAYLCRWIRKYYGATFKQLLSQKRFSVATDLLLTTSIPIHRIIDTVGYENSSYFHKEFKKRYGRTPKAVREEAKAQKS